MNFDFGDLLMQGVLFVLGTFFAVLLVLIVWDFVSEYRSFDARTACQVQRMVAVRKDFSTKVVCVPALERRDTLTIEQR
jgi:Sec-independent protein secretion pathway component TatC